MKRAGEPSWGVLYQGKPTLKLLDREGGEACARGPYKGDPLSKLEEKKTGSRSGEESQSEGEDERSLEKSETARAPHQRRTG